MNLTALQKAAAQAIVNIFETGSIHGNYADVTLMRGDTGQLTYGRSQTTLGAGIVYDSTVHGSWAHVRDITSKAHGELADIGEKKWMSAYVDERRNWLATHPNALLHKT